MIVVVLVSCFFVVEDSCAWSHQTLQQKLEAEPVAELVAAVEKFGNAKRGAMAFLKPELNCTRCHSLQSSQRKLGPDVTEKRQASIEHLVESILLPSKVIRDGYESVVVETLDGDSLSGVLVEEDLNSIVLDRIEEPEEPLVLDKANIEQWKKSGTSTMPTELVNQLSGRREFIDLIKFLDVLANSGPDVVKQLVPDSALFVALPLPEYESDIDHAGLIVKLNRRSFKRGQELFRLRCASCHGTVDAEGSMPTSLRFATGKFKHGSDPYTMYKTLTHGYGMMNAQRWMVPKQKYDVIHYIREHFLKRHNKDAYTKVDKTYLAGLPTGKSLGPEPVKMNPWTTMNYGPSLNNTIEVSGDGSNIAQKGIVVRLDTGPGGVESGSHWMLYDHDTMRVAGVWEGQFIDYNGIHFNGVHNQHPSIAGQLLYFNPVGPGFGRPVDGDFKDDRVVGRDGRNYGPLPKEWLRFGGMYRYGAKTVLEYQVGATQILESPAMSFVGQSPVYVRQINIGPRERDVIVQVLNTDGLLSTDLSGPTLAFSKASDAEEKTKISRTFDGSQFVQFETDRDWGLGQTDFTIYAEIKTKGDGTILCQTKDQDSWVADGQSLFVRDGRLNFDIGWVGDVDSDVRVDDGHWHRVAMTWREKDGQVRFYVDGEMESAGRLRAKDELDDSVFRIGLTNGDFPGQSVFSGGIKNVRMYSEKLSKDQLDAFDLQDAGLEFSWSGLDEKSGGNWFALDEDGRHSESDVRPKLVNVSLEPGQFEWMHGGGNLRLVIPAGEDSLQFSINISPGHSDFSTQWEGQLPDGSVDLKPFTEGGPAHWPEELFTDIDVAQSGGPFEVDVFKRPIENPWNDRFRLTGVDFLPGGRDAIVCCWDGSVYRVDGIDGGNGAKVKWKRIAAGLFQPLGVRVVGKAIFVSCRDQIVRLHDLNGNGEMDWYENFNSDHQVTEHFHEFAMGLQTDSDGNFYYAKSARHALEAVVPHHGTLLKVSSDGAKTEVVASGFRAANGVCLNPDGTFFVTDQEGHWNPKNRINWVQPDGFYGNMFGYHDVKDASDEAMEQPLCWITNAFDRSPGELLWVDSDRWGPLQGRLLNLSYGMGQVFVVPHEKLDGQWQGGMCAFPLENFPTGIMRGRFNALDGQLYCCGMFAWAGNQHQPGGLYRIRYANKTVYLPVAIRVLENRIDVEFSAELDRQSVRADAIRVEAWDLKRTRKYGSDHYNQREWLVRQASLSPDAKTVSLTVPDLRPTWCMSIEYSLRGASNEDVTGLIHNSIHKIGRKQNVNLTK